MEKKQSIWKFFSWNTLCLILIACLLNVVIWVAFHGIPLTGLPKKSEIEYVTIIFDGKNEKTIFNEEEIELLLKSTNLLNYQLWGETEGEPLISIIYRLKNGTYAIVEANNTTMWWHGKRHTIKEKDIFVKIIQGLFFDYDRE